MKGIVARELETNRTLWQFDAKQSWPALIDVDRQGNVLVSAEGRLMLLDANDGRIRFRLAPKTGNPSAGRFSADGSRIAWSSVEGGLEILDAVNGNVVTRLRGHSGQVFQRDADGPYQLIPDTPLGAHALAFSPDARTLASAGTNDLLIFELPSGNPLLRIEREFASMMALEFSPDGRFLALGDERGILELIDMRTRARSVLRLSESVLRDQEVSIRQLLFLPSGRLLVGTQGGALHEFEIVGKP
jgi:WD40 repeat protein